jgi:hypothetical protein
MGKLSESTIHPNELKLKEVLSEDPEDGRTTKDPPDGMELI